MIMMQNPFFKDLPSCSALSRSLEEQLFGTAPKTNFWLMVEYPVPFGEKALEESGLPDSVKSYLADLQKSIPAFRVLLIRRDKPETGGVIRVFAGASAANRPRLVEYRLGDYEEILSIDISSLASGVIDSIGKLRREPLFLVCTNGKRDPCCAHWGRPVYQAMSQLVGDSVWQTSHLGGHRFGANVVCLPHGIYYGHVNPDQVETLVDDYQKQRLTLANYRGRTCYDPHVQVAEYYLMSQTTVFDVDAYQLQSAQQISSNRWEISFLSRLDGSEHRLYISAKQSGFDNYESCNTPNKRSTHLQYHLEGWSKK